MIQPYSEPGDPLYGWIQSAQADCPDTRREAVTRLCERLTVSHADPQVLMCLIQRLQNDLDPDILIQCIQTMTRVKVYSAVVSLIDIALAVKVAVFESNDGFGQSEDALKLRIAAVQALGRMGDDRAILPLMSLLNNRDENYRLRLTAAESLGRLGDSHATTHLVQILNDERENSLYLKESAVKALGMLGDIRALEPLIDALEAKRGFRDKFNYLKERIIEAIGRIGRPTPKVTQNLLLALQDDAPSIRLAAIHALESIGDLSGLEPLMQAVFDRDDDIALAAISAVYALGGESAIKSLLKSEQLPQFIRDELESYLP